MKNPIDNFTDVVNYKDHFDEFRIKLEKIRSTQQSQDEFKFQHLFYIYNNFCI